jgi:hypothetical protein
MKCLIRFVPLLLLVSCAGPGYGGPWHSISTRAKSTEEILTICRELLTSDGFGVESADPAAGTMESKWKVQLSPHWYEGRRDKIEIRVAADETTGVRIVQFRAVRQVNEEHQKPQVLERASWGDSGGDEYVALRFDQMLKLRLARPGVEDMPK